MSIMFGKSGFISAVIVFVLGGCAITPQTRSVAPSQPEVILTGQMDDMMEYY